MARANSGTVRRIALALVCTALWCACEIYNTGYEAGYACADAGLGARDAIDEEIDRRNAEVAEWQANCNIALDSAFTTQPQIDDANDHCDEESSFGSGIVICTDFGPELGTEPDD